MKRLVSLAAGLVCASALAGQAQAAPTLSIRTWLFGPPRRGSSRRRASRSSGRTTCSCSRRRPAASSGSRTASLQGTVLDLAVNNASERGLLGIALHPAFPAVPWVYLYWSCKSTLPQDADPFRPGGAACSDDPAAMFGADTGQHPAGVPLLGNRVDRFAGTASTRVRRNLIQLRSFQHDGRSDPPGQGDEGQPPRANHDGGVIDFGPDGKLYVQVGDLGRRGQLQNLGQRVDARRSVRRAAAGQRAPERCVPPAERRRLDADDNPFFAPVRRSVARSARTCSGVRVRDPERVRVRLRSGLGRPLGRAERRRLVHGGQPGVAGPEPRLDADHGPALAALAVQGDRDEPRSSSASSSCAGRRRTSPTRRARRSRVCTCFQGAQYSDPEFSWKFEVAPAGVGFLRGRALGPQYQNDLFIGAARPTLEGEQLWRFNLTGNRRMIAVDDPRLEDRVADNLAKFELTESESLLFGRTSAWGATWRRARTGTCTSSRSTRAPCTRSPRDRSQVADGRGIATARSRRRGPAPVRSRADLGGGRRLAAGADQLDGGMEVGLARGQAFCEWKRVTGFHEDVQTPALHLRALALPLDCLGVAHGPPVFVVTETIPADGCWR